MNIYSEDVMENVRRALGLEKDDESMDNEIMEMDKVTVLGLYFQWEGIIGYEDEIVGVVSDIWDVYLD